MTLKDKQKSGNSNVKFCNFPFRHWDVTIYLSHLDGLVSFGSEKEIAKLL